MAAIRAVIFDLDGTLADTLADITASTNACLTAAGLPSHSEAEVRSFVGHGIGGLVERAMGTAATPERAASLVAAVREHYRAHCTEQTKLYAGIAPLLASLHQHGMELGVVSNKPHEMTTEIVDALMPSVEFGFVTGERPGIPLKPDPTGLLTACATLGVAPGTALYVGDTTVDIAAARAAGLRSVAVTWGFRDQTTLESASPDHIVHHPADILVLLRMR